MTRAATRGFTLVELVIAVAILSVGLLGSFSLMLTLRGSNQVAEDGRQGYRVSQRVMELVLADRRMMSSAAWVSKWNGKAFKDAKMPRAHQHGRITILPMAGPTGTMYEVTVRMETQGELLKPVKVNLVSWSAP